MVAHSTNTNYQMITKESYKDLKEYWDYQRKVQFNKELVFSMAGEFEGRVYNEFGFEGLCELLISIDKRGHWITDIMIENNDIDDILFRKYGVFDSDSIKKARTTDAMAEMNQKVWKLRRKYAKLIADELMGRVPTKETE